MSCKLSDKCDNVFACNVLRPEVELLGCSFYKPKKPMTNEEYIHSLNTEQLAEWIAHQTMIALLENQNNHSLRMTHPAYWVEWLKQPHTTIKE